MTEKMREKKDLVDDDIARLSVVTTGAPGVVTAVDMPSLIVGGSVGTFAKLPDAFFKEKQ